MQIRSDFPAPILRNPYSPAPGNPPDGGGPIAVAPSPDSFISDWDPQLSQMQQLRALAQGRTYFQATRQANEGRAVQPTDENYQHLMANNDDGGFVSDSLARLSALADENAHRATHDAPGLSPELAEQVRDAGATVNLQNGEVLPYGSITFRNEKGETETLALEMEDIGSGRVINGAGRHIGGDAKNAHQTGLLTHATLNGQSVPLSGWANKSWDEMPQSLRERIQAVRGRTSDRLLTEIKLLSHGGPDDKPLNMADPAQVRAYRERVKAFQETHQAQLAAYPDPRLGEELDKLGHGLSRQESLAGRQAAGRALTANPNDVERNRDITQSYHDISDEMRDMLGPDAGANWATWATWASKEAGTVIRGEQGWSKTFRDPHEEIARGNRRVYAEVAPEFARFIETFRGDQALDETKFNSYAKGFGSDQGDLKQAFRAYYEAMFASDTKTKQELTLKGNLLVGHHEQKQLDGDIDAALPYGGRTLATNMMYLHLPHEEMDLGKDVTPTAQGEFPAHLKNLRDPELRALIERLDAHPNTLEGSEPSDWSEFPQRMNYIVDLFRSRHNDESLFEEPYSAGERRQVGAHM